MIVYEQHSILSLHNFLPACWRLREKMLEQQQQLNSPKYLVHTEIMPRFDCFLAQFLNLLIRTNQDKRLWFSSKKYSNALAAPFSGRRKLMTEKYFHCHTWNIYWQKKKLLKSFRFVELWAEIKIFVNKGFAKYFVELLTSDIGQMLGQMFRIAE